MKIRGLLAFSVVILMLFVLGSAWAQESAGSGAKQGQNAAGNNELTRDWFALSLVIAQYDSAFQNEKWAPDSAPIRNIIDSIPKDGGLHYTEVCGLFRTRGRKPQEVKICLVPLKDGPDMPLFVWPLRPENENTPIIGVFFSKSLYSGEMVKGAAAGIESSVSDDFLDGWQGADIVHRKDFAEIASGRSRNDVELMRRLVGVTGELSGLNFLLTDQNFEKLYACWYNPPRADVEIKDCADIFLRLGLVKIQATINAAGMLAVCLKPEGCTKELDYARLKAVPELEQFVMPGTKPSVSDIKKYMAATGIEKFYPAPGICSQADKEKPAGDPRCDYFPAYLRKLQEFWDKN